MGVRRLRFVVIARKSAILLPMIPFFFFIRYRQYTHCPGMPGGSTSRSGVSSSFIEIQRLHKRFYNTVIFNGKGEQPYVVLPPTLLHPPPLHGTSNLIYNTS